MVARILRRGMRVLRRAFSYWSRFLPGAARSLHATPSVLLDVLTTAATNCYQAAAPLAVMIRAP